MIQIVMKLVTTLTLKQIFLNSLIFILIINVIKYVSIKVLLFHFIIAFLLNILIVSYFSKNWSIWYYLIDDAKIKQIQNNLTKIENLNFKTLNTKTNTELLNLFFFMNRANRLFNLSNSELDQILNKTNSIILQTRRTKSGKTSTFSAFFKNKTRRFKR